MRSQRILALNWRCFRHPEAGGAEVNLFRQAARWVRDGHKVTVLCARRAGSRVLPTHEIVDGISIRRVGGKFTVYLRAAIFLARHGREYDRILDVSNGVPFFAPLFTRTAGALLVHHFHGDQWFAEFPRLVAAFGSCLERWLVPVVYRGWPVIAVSSTTRDALLSTHFRPDQVTVIHNGVERADAGRVTPAAGPRSIIYFGRFKRYKRLERLVHAFASLRAEFPDTRLVMAGEGDVRAQIVGLVRQLGLTEMVRLPGFVDEATKAEMLASATVFATPSMHEGWGLSVIEANSYGCPAVAYDVPGLRVAIRDGETGFLAQDDASFREAIARILRDAGLRDRLSIAARAWAGRFDWDRCASETLAVLHLAGPIAAETDANVGALTSSGLRAAISFWRLSHFSHRLARRVRRDERVELRL